MAAKIVRNLLLKEPGVTGAPVYDRIDDEDGAQGCSPPRHPDNTSAATKLTFFLMGFFVASSISAAILVLVPLGVEPAACAEVVVGNRSAMENLLRL
ncbi:hypothetical protein Cob_v003480 [Colletotrichum orbiculare MAFF 240422]|uniref:Transmembrane protein n=1 Tax=Colletotrichum orbiculare (strain 104-T / ATCC 96160 / CBS 514.97 / LARS 414 / MAFF 240422) TaxID=1213857 RepID=A0A484G1J0_COLOR|nr:hypothetical protein Cob_v003480 [Colletotrichum orbiculare MAFF 240422]